MRSLTEKMEFFFFYHNNNKEILSESSSKVLVINFKLLITYELLKIGIVESRQISDTVIISHKRVSFSSSSVSFHLVMISLFRLTSDPFFTQYRKLFWNLPQGYTFLRIP